MPKLVINALSPLRVKRETRPGSYADGEGLYLNITKTGGRFWIWRGVVQGTRREYGIAPVRLVTLAEARETAREWRNIARAGGDPKEVRDRQKRQSMTLANAAKRVHMEQVKPNARNQKHCAQWLTTIETYAVPIIGSRPVHTLTQADVLRVLAPIWTAKPETARRVRQRLRTVLDWARTAGLFDGVNPVEGVEKGLPKQRDKVRHHTALPYSDLPSLMRKVEAVEGMGALALRFAILTAARSGEVRGATWAEIDMEARLWTLPAERMKAREPHRVPLSDLALAVLEAVQGLDDLVFPSRKSGRQVSDMTVSAVLRRLGVPVTVHGMRSTFRDWTEERTTFSHEIKEAALAHVVKNRVERAYRRGDLFEQRRELMDEWGVFCGGGNG